MTNHKIRRNDPCPCGSGKKYKKCCYNKISVETAENNIKPKFKFEPGSYGDVGNFMPSIACLKQTNTNDWKYHFVLVKPEEHSEVEDDAVFQATQDLDLSFQEKEKTGSDFTVAEVLKSFGYISVSDFHIVSE